MKLKICPPSRKGLSAVWRAVLLAGWASLGTLSAQAAPLNEEDALSESTARLLAAHCASSGFAERFVQVSQRAIRMTSVSDEADKIELLASQASAWSIAQIERLQPEDCADHLARLISVMKARETELARPPHLAQGKDAPVRTAWASVPANAH